MNVLITGINGALGLNTASKLLHHGYNVRGIGHASKIKHGLLDGVEIYEGDLLDKDLMKRALRSIDIVLHFGALTGFRDNMSDYISNNILGTASLLDTIKDGRVPVRKIIFASSSSVYGEGSYKCPEHGTVFPPMRERAQLEKREWEVFCPLCKQNVTHIPTDEKKEQSSNHLYAITKQTCERILDNFVAGYDSIAITMRFSVFYGCWQYKMVVPMFTDRILKSEEVAVTEDGCQLRDFLFLEDGADAAVFAMEKINTNQKVNVSSAEPVDLKTLIKTIGSICGKDPNIRMTGDFRPGDVRHIYLDNSKFRKLGFVPKNSLEEGIKKYIDWTNEVNPF